MFGGWTFEVERSWWSAFGLMVFTYPHLLEPGFVFWKADVQPQSAEEVLFRGALLDARDGHGQVLVSMCG